jgi:septal ring factor EnvC (AmiA/AmiB activator)
LTFTKNKELDLLNNTKNDKEETVRVLKSKEDSLIQAIKIKESETKKITSEILAILESKENKKSNLTPELKLISTNFSSNKGRLPWPVLSGSVISKFGKIPHPIISGITIMNNGIEISTTNTMVRSVFDGEVSKIIILPTGLKVVIVKHGDYLTVYSNLHTVNVEKGKKVKTKDNIGTLYVDKKKKHQTLGLQIWKARDKLNPLYWISRR